MITFKHVRYMIYSIIIFFIVSWYIPFNNTKIEPEVKPYYNGYIGIVKQYCKDDNKNYFHPNFEIEFTELPGREIGLCQIFPNAFRISIDKEYWNAVDDTNRFSLLVHELCHCEFDIPHYSSPSHFMYYADTFLTKETIIKQLKEILENKCRQD